MAATLPIPWFVYESKMDAEHRKKFYRFVIHLSKKPLRPGAFWSVLVYGRLFEERLMLHYAKKMIRQSHKGTL